MILFSKRSLMMQLTKGNILEANAEALVNTVNTKGIMGKGIALQFKKAFPDVFNVSVSPNTGLRLYNHLEN